MDEINFFTNVGKIQGILQRHIAAAHDSRRLSAEKSTVASCTVRNAGTGKFLFALNGKCLMTCPCRKKNRFCFYRFSARKCNLFHFAIVVNRGHFSFQKRNRKRVSVLTEFHCQLITAHSIEAEIIVNALRRNNLTAAKWLLLDHNLVKHCALCINRRRQASRPTSNNHQIFSICHNIPSFLCKSSQSLRPYVRRRQTLPQTAMEQGKFPHAASH